VFAACPTCGRYSEDRAIDPVGPYAIYPHCGGAHPFRQSSGDAFVERMVALNAWLCDHAATTNPPMTLLDTTNQSVEATVAAVRAWIGHRLGGDALGALATHSGLAR